jgi:hypothetical protein
MNGPKLTTRFANGLSEHFENRICLFFMHNGACQEVC